jgi:hypothetical protein
MMISFRFDRASSTLSTRQRHVVRTAGLGAEKSRAETALAAARRARY